MNETDWNRILDADETEALALAETLPPDERRTVLAEREAWISLRGSLKEHLAAPQLPHPDFVNARVLEEISRENRSPKRSLGWLVWPGLASLAAAALLALVLLPEAMGPRGDGAFSSQIVSAQAGAPELSVSSFAVPGQRGVVIWIDGVADIPQQEPVQ